LQANTPDFGGPFSPTAATSRFSANHPFSARPL
jgi:hypothetical protein